MLVDGEPVSHGRYPERSELAGWAGVAAPAALTYTAQIEELVAIGAANADSPWWGLLAAPQNMHASIAKYPLLALPMFVLVGSIFDRSGVARRMVTFAEACVGRAPGTLPAVDPGLPDRNW